MASPPSSLHPTRDMLVIEADQRGTLLELRELLRFRELLLFLACRDVRVRYRQTLLGAAWALIEPFVNVILFTLLFNRLAGFESGEIPYPLYTFAAVLLWTFFARALRATTVSLTANARLVTKAYFPRMVLPLAGIGATSVDFCCAFLMYGLMMLWFGITPNLAVLTVPVWVLLAAINALGVGLVLGSVNVRFRDVSQAVPFLTQVWMFATPVAYPLGEIPTDWLGLYLLNPMVGVVEGMRWALLPNHEFHPILLVPTVVMGVLVLGTGLVYFRRAQRRFADIV